MSTRLVSSLYNSRGGFQCVGPSSVGVYVRGEIIVDEGLFRGRRVEVEVGVDRGTNRLIE